MKRSFFSLAVSVVVFSVIFVMPARQVVFGYHGKSDEISQKPEEGYRSDKMRKERWGEFQKNRVDRLADLLSLTPEQKEKISAILEDGKKQIDAERENMKKRVAELRNSTDKKIENVLNEEQKKKFRAHKEEMARKMKERQENLRKRWQYKKDYKMPPPPPEE